LNLPRQRTPLVCFSSSHRFLLVIQRKNGLAASVRDAKNSVTSLRIANDVYRPNVTDASGEVVSGALKVPEHDLNALIVMIEGHPEQWITGFLPLRAESRIVDFD
jgi:hypothetical protein